MDAYQILKDVWAGLTAAGEPFEMKEIQVRGNPMRTYVAAPGTLRDVWLASAQFADRDYLVYNDERWTYAQAHDQVASIANWLQDQGVQPGDRVAIAMRNYPEWLLCYWATLSIGAACVGMNAWWVGPEMVYGLNDAQPKVLIADKERLERLLPHLDEVGTVQLVSVRHDAGRDDITPFQALLECSTTLPDVVIDPDDDACIFYTSGTTGRPKGAQLTHRGCVHNIMNMAFAGALYAGVGLIRGTITQETIDNAPIPAALVTTPLFHVTANNCVAHGTTLNGGKLVHMYKWDAGDALGLIQAEGITAMTGVPTMAREVINHPDFPTTDTSTLVSLGGGGAQLQPDLVGKIDATVQNARPGTGYGMTETCGIITSISGDFFVDRPASAGPAMPVFETRLVDDDGNDVAAGEVGELWVRGAPVIKGYLNRQDATAETITDGWLHTGDVARIDDDGFIFIVDRKKDMVLRGGENIYCAEVESVIFDHDAVAECTVFGVPDDRLGEEVGVAIFLKPGAQVSADELRTHCKAQLASHKTPRYVWFMDEALPRNASGKFLKRELRDTLNPAQAA